LAGHRGIRRVGRAAQDVAVAAVGVQFGASTPGSLEALITTAPAPSPNSTQVLRSLKSRMRENTSVPITSTFFALPALMKASAVDSA
jgi:hypothetical protein